MVRFWTRRRQIDYSCLCPGARQDVPIFVHQDDADSVFFTDVEGRPLPCCRDYVYEALDHSLFWLSCKTSESGVASVFIFSDMPGGCGGPQLRRADEVVALAEFFHGGRSGVLNRWQIQDTATGTTPARRLISIEPFCAGSDCIGSPVREPDGDALWLEPSDKATVLQRTVVGDKCGRVHLRVHFFDDGERGNCCWMGCRSMLGTGAVGLPEISEGSREEFYAFVHGGLPINGKAFGAWQRSGVPRSKGWHMFEMVWEDGCLHVLIDTEPISKEWAACSHVEEQIFLGHSGPGYGVWAGLELFNTPVGQSTWAIGVQKVRPASFPPWEVQQEEENGFWQNSGDFVIQHVSVGRFVRLVPTWQQMVDSFDAVARLGYSIHPVMQLMLGGVYEAIEELPDGMIGLLCPDGFMRHFPPAVWVLHEDGDAEKAIPQSATPEAILSPEAASVQCVRVEEQQSEARPAEVPSAEPEAKAKFVPDGISPTKEPALAIECWSLPGETDVAQIERIVAHFVQILGEEGTVLPENIRLIAPCKEKSHMRCFVYRFGGRRLHLAARANDDGRLTLVVRCGGGFMDFLDFARRHGGLERVRMHRHLCGDSTGGRGNFTSVRVAGQMQVRQNSK